ncbi:MAG: serine/threonine protein kinase, partial [Myxococcaceae bacterium]|nr:serine/threonine protein kinase [Myxococcaceae bacterium]
MPSSSPTTTCPREDVLVAYQLGTLDEAEREATRAHLEGCAACRAAAGAVGEATQTLGPVSGGATVSPGQRVGRFVLMERLGAGAMGTVYAAYDSELDRRVALKFLKLRGGTSWNAARRDAMTREARALARVAHPNVLAVFDVGMHDAQPFLATEFVDGGNLRQALAARPRTSDEVLRILVDAGEGLHAAHLAGLVHRDFKPENVMLGRDGRPRVADFGLAGELGPATESAEPRAEAFEPGALATLVEQRGRVGTPAYMAPEVARGERATALSDQFSFCVAAVEALGGKRPFPDALTAERAAAIERGPGELEALPRRVRAALGRGLAARPEARFASMGELLERLR